MKKTNAPTFCLGFTEIEGTIWHYTRSIYHGYKNPVRLVAQATNFYVVVTNISSIITEVFSYVKKECQFTCTEQKAPDNREVHRSFKKRRSL
jgi:hypothetical protein